jgi:hypothetical protein
MINSSLKWVDVIVGILTLGVSIATLAVNIKALKNDFLHYFSFFLNFLICVINIL